MNNPQLLAAGVVDFNVGAISFARMGRSKPVARRGAGILHFKMPSESGVLAKDFKMLTTTYHAVLKGNHLEWSGEAPPEIAEERAVSVDVTIHREELLGVSPKENVGERMAAALEKLAAANATTSIEDPVAWQREVRRDRVFTGRD